MRKHPDKDLDEIEIIENFEEDPDYEYNEYDEGRNRVNYSSGLASKLPIFLGIALGIVVVIIILFFRGGEGISQDDLRVLNAKLERIDKKIGRIDALGKKVNKIEKEMGKAIGDVKSQSNTLNGFKKRIDSLDKKVASLSSKKASVSNNTSKKATASKALYYVVKKGDTLYGISRDQGIPLKELCRINGFTVKASIKPGQRLLISK